MLKGVSAARRTLRKPPAVMTSRNITAKHPRRGRFGDVSDMTPEEHKPRGDAADALFREMKRQIAASKRS